MFYLKSKTALIILPFFRSLIAVFILFNLYVFGIKVFKLILFFLIILRNFFKSVLGLYAPPHEPKIFFPFTLRSKNHPFWDVKVRNTYFLRSASLLVEKHFCRIHYSFSICHSCQVIDLLLMTSQKCYFYLNFFNKKDLRMLFLRSRHQQQKKIDPHFC